MSGTIRRFRSPGPVASRFLHSIAAVRGIMGPIGSGKTSACLIDMINKTRLQNKNPGDGCRYARYAVIRDTFRNLNRTTLKSWHNWVPADMGSFAGGGNEPATHRFQLPHEDGSLMKIEVMFVAIGDNAVEDVCRGFELTGAYLNEADLLSPEVFTFIQGRVGRYPSADMGGCAWSGLWMDFNAPDDENWVCDLFIFNRPEGVEFFRQPSGLSPEAENLVNLPVGYYERAMVGQPDWYVRRMIKNELGYSREGKPCYPEFNDMLHVPAEPLKPEPGLPLLVGLDAGGRPAGIFGQRRPNGQARILGEVIGGDDGFCGPDRFSELLNRSIRENFGGLDHFGGNREEAARGMADPSAVYGVDREAGESDWIQIVSRKTGIRIRPAPTNQITTRLDAVRVPLTRMIDGHTPAFLLSPVCRVTRKGFNSGYHYKRVIANGQTRYQEVPNKNEYSHPHDALQYWSLDGGGYDLVMARQSSRTDATAWTRSLDDGEAPAAGGKALPAGFYRKF